jgi:hypothetical protein
VPGRNKGMGSMGIVILAMCALVLSLILLRGCSDIEPNLEVGVTVSGNSKK